MAHEIRFVKLYAVAVVVVVVVVVGSAVVVVEVGELKTQTPPIAL